jgi:hypothetical protein
MFRKPKKSEGAQRRLLEDANTNEGRSAFVDTMPSTSYASVNLPGPSSLAQSVLPEKEKSNFFFKCYRLMFCVPRLDPEPEEKIIGALSEKVNAPLPNPDGETIGSLNSSLGSKG